MPYPELMVAPMREELTQLGVKELKTGQDVDEFISAKDGTALLLFNSVCGCAAGAARPAVALSMQDENRPDQFISVFAGQDVEATEKARGYFPQLPPSSPSIVLLRNGEPTHYVPRHMIEGRDAQAIAGGLADMFKELQDEEG